MATNTTPNGLRFPDGNEKVKNGRLAIQHLAEDVETVLLAGGKSIVSAEQGRTDTSFGLLSTADVVPDVVVPANAVIQVRYFAAWKESVVGAARASIFINENAVKNPGGTALSVAIPAGISANTYAPLISDSRHGLGTADANVPYTAPDSSGTLLIGQASTNPNTGATEVYPYGGPCEIFALPAGTYDFSVRFRAVSGTVTVKQRFLWVRVLPPGA